MTTEQVIEQYKSIVDKENLTLLKAKSKIFRVGTLRLLVVMTCIGLSYYLWGNGLAVSICILLSFVSFLFLLKKNNALQYKKSYCEQQIFSALDELKALEYDFTAFESGKEFINPDHNYSYDLDLFGNNSLFQSLNRTVTLHGKETLADSLLYPNTKKEAIEEQQSLIKRLAEKFDVLRHFISMGQMKEMDNTDIKKVAQTFVIHSQDKPFSKSNWRYTLYVTPILALANIAVCATNMIPISVFLFIWCLLIVFSAIPIKRLKNNIGVWDKSLDTLQTYSRLLQIVEQQNKEGIYVGNKSYDSLHLPSKCIATLGKHVENFNQTFTLPGILILNPLLMWDIRHAIKIEEWIDENKDRMNEWIDDLAKFDSLVSLATFAYNHPEYNYPEIANSFTFEAKGLGHPLIHRGKCVCNDVSIVKHPFFLVVTGANMAGKSTYLRTVGISLVLASVGVPIFADSLHFFPFQLVTNLRTSDSLTDNESYFFAELKRLKMIIDKLENGEELFIILDEILKGTNSEDKQRGSIALMKQLIAEKGCGIIATHDLILGELENEFPNQAKSYRFEADIEGDNLSFSYKIREGVAQNMNACFLMKKMGITGL